MKTEESARKSALLINTETINTLDVGARASFKRKISQDPEVLFEQLDKEFEKLAKIASEQTKQLFEIPLEQQNLLLKRRR